MSAHALDGAAIDLDGLGQAVEERLAEFLDGKAAAVEAGVLPGEVVEELRRFVFAGGKRLRPVLCLLGWHAAGGDTVPATVVRVAASLEMFHAFALIHDDVIDNSATRRGGPTVHVALAARHRDGLDAQRARDLGRGVAVLIGDLALAWSDELLHTAGMTPAQWEAVLPVVDVMRTEVMGGQYLDVVGAGGLAGDVERALSVVRYKTAKYTCERPLHIGAALAGGTSEVMRACTAFAMPLGEAFQLRDDLLGVFGDPAQTGKSCLDDLRGGKSTVLMALAVRAADAGQLRDLHALVGNPVLDGPGASRVRDILRATGAVEAAEQMIKARHEQAMAALTAGPFPPAVADPLRRIVDSHTRRMYSADSRSRMLGTYTRAR
ncbi:polyprenyl synthetase family protein [Streptomyces sp. NPDC059552]|uniref:polyprenyl synthetase family protein n=1 Tax=Streptomyces sp. NPDC059552 TaxID=3346862 RepID=UPI0036CC5EE8